MSEMADQKAWMIYGANGYTGELIARESKARGLKPILAGRNKEKVESLAKELGLESLIFDLGDTKLVTRYLDGINTVVHCAGPFSATHKPMFSACLKTKTNYLDITGEMAILERVHHKSEEIRRAGIVVIPGVGFDVVPSDCLAAMLKRDLPDAAHLTLAFMSEGSVSPGTMKTMIEGLPLGGAIRENGKITPVRSAYKSRKIRFRNRERLAVTIPWGDVASAYHSTGIPNIEVYLATNAVSRNVMLAANYARPILALSPVQKLLKKIVDKTVFGDSDDVRKKSKTYLWGEATNATGKRIEHRLVTPHGYEITADAAIRIAQEVLAGKVKPGPSTPSKAFGADFVLSLKNVSLVE